MMITIKYFGAVSDATQKKEYISTLGNSFKQLLKQPQQWNEYTEKFFDQELDRLLINAQYLYDSINLIGINREKTLSTK